MPIKFIGNPGGAWATGASWQTYTDPGESQIVADMLNVSGGTLYPGDVVILSDATGANVTTVATANSAKVIGTVGGLTNQTYAGGAYPATDLPWVYSTGTWNTGAANYVTDTNTITTARTGYGIYGPGIPAGATITGNNSTAWTLSANVTANNNSATTYYMGPSVSAVGPGWANNTVVPVVIGGWNYVTIGNNSANAAGNFAVASGTARIANIVTTTVASSNVQSPIPGSVLGVTLENANAAIASPDGVNFLLRCWIRSA